MAWFLQFQEHLFFLLVVMYYVVRMHDYGLQGELVVSQTLVYIYVTGKIYEYVMDCKIAGKFTNTCSSLFLVGHVIRKHQF